MKKHIHLFFAFMLATLIFVGCSNNNTDDSVNEDDNKTNTNTTTTSGSDTDNGNTSDNKDGKKLEGTLNVATAGDTNMEELQTQEIVPLFNEKVSKDINVNVVGTGAGDAGSVTIVDKLKAQKEAGKENVDIDVAIVHQSAMEALIENDLIEKWLPLAENSSNVVSEDSKNSLGTDVEGYVAPLFHSQVAIAYNTKNIDAAFKSFDELTEWIKNNPNKFGYNGIKNGASGVAFTTAYVYYKTGDYDTLVKGPYDKGLEDKWPEIMKELKALPVTYTNGNNGTLDMLNRGEIDAGPVWVDMFNSWKAEGRMSPDVSLSLPEPGLPGQPMYIVIPKNATNKEAAVEYANFLISNDVQADVIVEKYNWYPGVNADAVMDDVSDEAKKALFENISADDLNKNGKSFPLGDYFKNLKDSYEIN